MRISKYQAAVLVAATLVLIGFTCASAAQLEERSDVNHPPTARARIQLPKLFDFRKFTALFKKHYSSTVEALVRQKIYLARAFSAFISVVSYKHEKSTSYLSVNSRSDRTPEELAQHRISADKMRASFRRDLKFKPQEPPKPEVSDKPEPLPVADLADIEQELEKLSELKGDSGARAIVEELGLDKRRSRRDVGRRRQLSVDELMRPQVNVEPSNKIQRMVPSNNPDFVPAELPSEAAAGAGSDADQAKPMDSSSMSLFSKVSSLPYIKFVVEWAADQFEGPHAAEKEAEAVEPEVVNVVEVEHEAPALGHSLTDGPALADRMFVDHRDSKCFFEPRYQGSCGSCYSFATVALFEFLYCRETQKLVAFSEQYLVDCGRRYELDGCDGAALTDALNFVDEMGLHLRSKYPYRADNGTCPYDQDAPIESMGYLRLVSRGHNEVEIDRVDERLQAIPLLLALKLNKEFAFYGGGVDEMRGCSDDDAHAMLIVGHGREDGMDYYLLRNSYDLEWGEQGYYKLSQRALKKCLADDVVFESRAAFSQEAKSKSTDRK